MDEQQYNQESLIQPAMERSVISPSTIGSLPQINQRNSVLETHNQIVENAVGERQFNTVEHADANPARYSQVTSKTKAKPPAPSGPSAGARGANQQPLQRLLKGFRLGQYNRKMADYGYEQDVYKLGLLSVRERDDMLDNLQLLPGHRERMIAMFKVIEQSNPKATALKTLQNAQAGIFESAPPVQQQRQSKLQIQKRSSTTLHKQGSSLNRSAQRYNNGRQNSLGKSKQSSNTNKDQDKDKDTSLTDSIAFKNQIVFNAADTAAYIQELGTKNAYINQQKAVTPANASAETQIQFQIQTNEMKSVKDKNLNQQHLTDFTSPIVQASLQAEVNILDLNKIYKELDVDQKKDLNEQFLNQIQAQSGALLNGDKLVRAYGTKNSRKVSQEIKAQNALNNIFPQKQFGKNKEGDNEKKKMIEMYIHSNDTKKVRNSVLQKPTRPPPGTNISANKASARPPMKGVRVASNQRIQSHVKSNSLSRYASNKNPPKFIPQERINRNSVLGGNQNQNNLKNIQYDRANELRRRSKSRGTGSNLQINKNTSRDRGMTNIPALSNKTTQDGFIQSTRPTMQERNRSREGSQIGRGFFNRRNSSARGSRKTLLSNENPMSQYGLKVPTDRDNSINLNNNPSSVAATTNKESSTANVLQNNDSTTMDQTTPKRMSSARRRQGSTAKARRPQSAVQYVEKEPELNTPSTVMRQKVQIPAGLPISPKKTPKHNLPLSPSKQQRRPVEQSQADYSECYSSAKAPLLNSSSANTPNLFKIKPIESDEVANVNQTIQEKQMTILQNESANQTPSVRNSQTPITTTKQIETMNNESPLNQDITREPEIEIINQMMSPESIQNNVSATTATATDQNKPDSQMNSDLSHVDNKKYLVVEEQQQNFSSPLLSKDEKSGQMNYGHSFNSKLVAQGPTFFNLRIMCVCVGRAIQRHVEYSKGENWLLDDLQENPVIADLNSLQKQGETEHNFTYNFKENLKITTTKKEHVNEQEFDGERAKESIDNSGNRDSYLYASAPRNQSGEYESDQFEDAEEEKRKTEQRKSKFSSIENQGAEGLLQKLNASGSDQYTEIDDDDDDIVREGKDIDDDDLDVELSFKEVQQIKRIRDQEVLKQTMNKEQLRLTGIQAQNSSSNQLRVSGGNFQFQNPIANLGENRLSGIRQSAMAGIQEGLYGPESGFEQMRNMLNHDNMSNQMGEILATSGEPDHLNREQQFSLDFFGDGPKMTRAEFIMAGLDLDPIESHYSAELRQLSEFPSGTRPSIGMQINGDDEANKIIGSSNLQLKAQVFSGRTGPDAVDQSVPKNDLLDSITRGLQKIEREQKMQNMKQKLQFFDIRYNYDTEEFVKDMNIVEPTSEQIATYCKYVTISSKMENETPVIALVYMERLLKKSGILINKYNWKRFLLVCLCVASKVWDDDSLENIHFPQVMKDVSLKMLNKLEQILLDSFLDYDLVVKGSEYAKYYFIIRTLADDLKDNSQMPDEIDEGQNKRRKRRRADDWAEFPLLQPISAQQMQNLQRNAAKAEIYLKERHEKEIIYALADKFKAKDQKNRVKKFDSTL